MNFDYITIAPLNKENGKMVATVGFLLQQGKAIFLHCIAEEFPHVVEVRVPFVLYTVEIQ